MSRKMENSETVYFARSLMVDVCFTFEKFVLEKIDEAVTWEGFRKVWKSIWPYTVDTGHLSSFSANIHAFLTGFCVFYLSI